MACESLRFGEEICKWQQNKKGEVGEQKNVIPQPLDQGAVEPLHVVGVWVVEQNFVAHDRNGEQKNPASGHCQ